jgi:hypothetical protein
MKYCVSLGMTINMGDFNSVRAEVSSDSEDYMVAFEESRTRLYDAAYHLAKEVSAGIGQNMTSIRAIDFLASKLNEEPRI